jgi:hypothetical protein
MFISFGGKRMYLWRAVDAEGEVLDCLVQSRRNKRAALRLMRKLIRKYRMVPAKFVTDRLPSYAAARAELPVTIAHERGLRQNNRAESSHFRCDDESERCNASGQPGRLRDSSRHMLRSITLSTSVAISSGLQRSVDSAAKPSTHGAPCGASLAEVTFTCNRLDRTQQRDKPARDTSLTR